MTTIAVLLAVIAFLSGAAKYVVVYLDIVALLIVIAVTTGVLRLVVKYFFQKW